MGRKLVCIPVLFCCLAAANAQSSWNRVASLTFDWNGHQQVRVVFEIPKTWKDPGDYTRIRIQVPGQHEFALNNNYGWVKISSDAAFIPASVAHMNQVHSDYLLAVNVAKTNRMLLILIGDSYASSPGSLDVIELAKSGEPHLILHRENLGLTDVRDLDDDGIAEIIGYPCLSQEFGNGLQTYDPTHVYKLAEVPGRKALLSLPLSEDYNLKHYYGWVGPQCSEKFAVVLHPPGGGKPFVTTTSKAERITTKRLDP
jgi:hypothetical protein